MKRPSIRFSSSYLQFKWKINFHLKIRPLIVTNIERYHGWIERVYTSCELRRCIMRNGVAMRGGVGMVECWKGYKRIQRKTKTDHILNRERVRHARTRFSRTGRGREGVRMKCFNWLTPWPSPLLPWFTHSLRRVHPFCLSVVAHVFSLLGARAF